MQLVTKYCAVSYGSFVDFSLHYCSSTMGMLRRLVDNPVVLARRAQLSLIGDVDEFFKCHGSFLLCLRSMLCSSCDVMCCKVVARLKHARLWKKSTRFINETITFSTILKKEVPQVSNA